MKPEYIRCRFSHSKNFETVTVALDNLVALKLKADYFCKAIIAFTTTKYSPRDWVIMGRLIFSGWTGAGNDPEFVAAKYPIDGGSCRSE